MSKRLGKNDIVFIIIIFILIALISLCLIIFRNNSSGMVIITVNGERYKELSLSDDLEFEIKDSSGNTTNILVIKDGKADMIDATCPDKLCVHQKAISYDMESIICLPNKVVVTVSSDIENDYDVIAN